MATSLSFQGLCTENAEQGEKGDSEDRLSDVMSVGGGETDPFPVGRGS